MRRIVIAALVITVSVSAFPLFGATTVLSGVGTIESTEIFAGSDATAVISQVILEPGEVGGWHYHPGGAYVIVKSGQVTTEDGCGGSKVFGPAQGFEESGPHVHRVRNVGGIPVEMYVLVMAPVGQPRTVNLPGPLCGPPQSKDECKDGGWLQFTFPEPFQNEGDCVSSVVSPRR